MEESSPFSELEWRALGPKNCGGRMEGIDSPAGQPSVIYAAAGSGGVWKSVNGGLSWEHVFAKESTFAVGDVTVDPNDAETVWVGTGEAHLGGWSYDGTGVFNNFGTINKTDNTTSYIENGITFNSTDTGFDAVNGITLNIADGFLSFRSASSLFDGHHSITGAGKVVFAGGTHDFTPGSLVTGDFEINNSTAIVNLQGDFQMDNLTLVQGTLNLGTVDANSTFTINSSACLAAM